MTTKETTPSVPLPFDPSAITEAFEQGSLHAAEITNQNELAARLPEVAPPFRELAQLALTDAQRASVTALQDTTADAFNTLVAEQAVREEKLGALLEERREATATHLGQKAEKAAELRRKKQETDKLIFLPEDQANAIIARELRKFDLDVRDLPETKARVRAILEAIREVREARSLGALAGKLLVVPELLPEITAAPTEKPPTPDNQPAQPPAKAAAPRRRAKAQEDRTKTGATEASAEARADSTVSRVAGFFAAKPGAVVTSKEIAKDRGVYDDSDLTEEKRHRYVAILLTPSNLPRIRAMLRTSAGSDAQPMDIQVGTRTIPTTTKRGKSSRSERVFRSLPLEGEAGKHLFRKFTEMQSDGSVIEWEKPAPLRIDDTKKIPASRSAKPGTQQPKASSSRAPKQRTAQPKTSTETRAVEPSKSRRTQGKKSTVETAPTKSATSASTRSSSKRAKKS